MKDSAPRNLLGQKVSRSSMLEPKKMLAAEDEINTATWQETNFDDGDWAPFNDFGLEGDVVNGFFRSHFDASFFVEQDSWRIAMGKELLATDEFESTDAYTGFSMYIPNSFPDTEETIISQYWQHTVEGTENWASKLLIENDELWLVSRSYSGGPEQVEYLATLPKDEWMDFTVRMKPGRDGNGQITVNMNGEELYDGSVDFGWGGFDDSGTLTGGWLQPRVGIYAASGYNGGDQVAEDRYLYFDNLSMLDNDSGTYSEAEAWENVDPS